jgi:hypothetical protein
MKIIINEENDWEGETFGYILDVSEQELKHIEDILKNDDGNLAGYILEIKDLPINEIDKINKYSDNTYMDRLNTISRPENTDNIFLKLSNKNFSDVFYKGVNFNILSN